jgi:flagellar biosynthesis protein FliR
LDQANALSLQLHGAGIATFMAILLRLSVVLFMVPPLSNTRVPFRIKVSLAVALAAMLYPLFQDRLPPLCFEPVTLAWTVVSELLLGMVLAFSLVVVLAAFDLTGQVISFVTGLSFAQVVDPTGSAETAIFSTLLQMVATLLLLQLNLHHLLLKAIVESFTTLPVGAFTVQPATIGRLVLVCGQLFVIAIKLSAPVLVVILLSQVGFGVISKFAPRINILVTSFPLTIALGLFFVMLSIPLWGGLIQRLFVQAFGLIQTMVGMNPVP